MGWQVMPGVPAAGHVTSGGFWHSGAEQSCHRTPCEKGVIRMTLPANLYTQDRDPVSGLTQNQRTVLDGLTKGKKTQLEISIEMGISRQRVNQIVNDLKRKGYKFP